MVNGYGLIREICIGAYFFLSGVEYAVILPTLNGFLNYLGAEQYFLGLVISAFSLTSLLSAPIYGKISDRTKTSKACIVVGNVFEIAGNFMYFASTNKYMALSSRFIAGIGAGASSAIYGMITRSTTDEERTKAFSKFILINLIGNIVGPSFNIFLNSINFSLGPFKVTELNAPGLWMTMLWTVHTFLTIILYKDPDLSAGISGRIASENSNGAHGEHQKVNTSVDDVAANVRSFKDEFLRDEIIACLTANFLVLFSQSVIETALAPTTKILFDWGGLFNSYLYGAAGAIVVLGFGPLMWMMKCVSDRAIFLGGVIGTIVIYVIYTAIFLILRIKPEQVGTPWVLPVFLTSVGLLTMVLPYTSVAQSSIFSKLTSEETQAFNQGIRLATEGIARIIGPIWASSLSTLEGIPIMMGVNLLLNIISLGMILGSYERLETVSGKVDIDKGNANSLTSTGDDISPEQVNESSPLLSA